MIADDSNEQAVDTVNLLFATLNYQLEQFQSSDAEILRLARGNLTEGMLQKLRPHLEERSRQRELDRSIKYFESQVRVGLIADFVQKHVKAKNDYAKQRFAREIAEGIRQGKRSELEPYLVDVLDLGLEKAREKQQRESNQGNSKYIYVGWEVFKGLIQIGIVLAVFGIADSKFQTVVFALLIMTYNGLVGAASFRGYFELQTLAALNEEFERLRRLLKQQLGNFDEGEQSEQTRKMIKAADKFSAPFFIQATFVFVTWVIALWKLGESIVK